MSQSSVSLAEYLSARARSSSDSRLVFDAIGGLGVVLLFSFWRIPAWYTLVATGTCFLGYGVWAIAGRELLALGPVSRSRTLALRTLAAVAATCGLGAGVFLIMVVLARMLGRIIS